MNGARSERQVNAQETVWKGVLRSVHGGEMLKAILIYPTVYKNSLIYRLPLWAYRVVNTNRATVI